MALIPTRTALRAPSLSSSIRTLTLAGLAIPGLCTVAPLAAQDAAPATETVAKSDAPPVVVVRPSGLYLDLPEQGSDFTALLTGGGAQPNDFYEFLDLLAELKENEIDEPETLGMSFSVNEEVFGKVIERELKQGGKNIQVTEKNKKVRRYHTLTKSV